MAELLSDAVLLERVPLRGVSGAMNDRPSVSSVVQAARLQEEQASRLHHGVSRREALQRVACGFGSVALAGLLAEEAVASEASNPLAPRAPHFAARAKRVI